jgi:hypothetical protein
MSIMLRAHTAGSKSATNIGSKWANGCPLPTVVTVSVVGTTFRRTERLAARLQGLASQTRSPDEVVVVIHVVDEESAALVKGLAGDWPVGRCVTLERHGLVRRTTRAWPPPAGDRRVCR